MCSILAILEIDGDADALRDRALRLSARQRHRGPDWSGVHGTPRALLVHERLAIVDVLHGAQPLVDRAGTLALAVNGEIYNHAELEAGLREPYPFQTASDCEVILPLFRELGPDLVHELSGIFAFVLYDESEDRYLIARDPIGVVPLYTGRDQLGRLYVASEMKALIDDCVELQEFPPGHLLDSRDGVARRYYRRAWMDETPPTGTGAHPGAHPGAHTGARPGAHGPRAIRDALEGAIHQQLMSDVPYGVLLSGGLDSSIIAAVTARFAPRRVEDHDRSPAWWPRLHSFSIGLEGSPDLAMAEEVARHIGSAHHGFHFTLQEGLDALPDVIHHLETYDVTTIRAGTPMYLMARRIRSMGVKMVLSGEGADEVFGGYLYFHRAPDPEAFHRETVRKLDRLHLYDCLRANKAMAAWGVEARVPFLDKDFLDVAMALDPAAKMAGPDRMEKHILREAFEDLLPGSVTWRQKEQFSDGVGYGWIDALRDHAEHKVTDSELADAPARFPIHPPHSKEAYLYRALFEERFPLESAAACVPGGPSVACSTPEALEWDASLAELNDPSGRAVRGVHKDAYGPTSAL